MAFRWRPVLAVSGLLLIAFLAGCRQEAPSLDDLPVETLFTQLPSAYTGVTFENRLTESERFNVITYRNFYDGGGVGLADFNGDGLLDLYLTANQEPNRLYLNRGAFRFENVTDAAGVAGARAWATGVSIADVNGDGLLDLYVCNSGDAPGDDRANELFINQGAGEDGVPRFEEQGGDYGLDDRGYSTHAAFLDYDRDGDLDLYLMNNASSPIGGFEVRQIRHLRHRDGGDKLFRNDDGVFVDVSEEVGIYGSEIGFGLGVTVGDINKDGWPDLYLSNDFFERDYLYVNNRDGTFSEEIEAWMPHTSLSSMGADMADIDNDGFAEIYVTDMLPEHDRRLKTTSTFDPWRVYQASRDNGFHRQFMRNMLHLNNADPDASGQGFTFSEIGQLAGVARTDWSWSALIADYDLDGFKDIFVTNGVFRDLTDQDFIEMFSDEAAFRAWIREEGSDFRKLLDLLPSTPIPNYLFHNDGDLTFTNEAAAWGLATPSFSNGAAYGDLDNDGDLDLVVNNVNQEAFVYRNEADTLLANHFLQVALEGEGRNRFGLGAKVTAHHGGQQVYLEQVPTRGFQSAVDPVLTLGLGEAEKVDSLVVAWPDGRVQVLMNVATNQRLTLRQAEAVVPSDDQPRLASPAVPRFANVTAEVGLEYTHQENDFVDFDREGLLPKMVSTEGPRVATGDVNGDGRTDVFIGGAKGSPGALFLQQAGGFARSSEEVFASDQIAEDVGAAFFDAEGDGDLDLYVVSGGSEFSQRAPGLRDRLYLNDGRGRFTRAEDRLPLRLDSGSVVAPADYDGDGDTDLFVGGRVVPWRYGETPESVLLQNDGRGRFTVAPPEAAPGLATVGLVTDAAWTDYDGDGRLDLILVGEWMPVTVFRNAGGGRLEDVTAPAGLARTHGWWNTLLVDDLDGDGDPDLVAGNLGRNTLLHAAPDQPLTMHVADFDNNGYAEQILSRYEDGKRYPMVLKNELTQQIPSFAARFASHADYAGKTLDEVFTPEELASATVKQAYLLETSLFENQGNGTFAVEPLPLRAQFAPVYGLLADDFDGDGHRDLLLAGNFFEMRPQIGRMDASYGLLLRGDGAGGFTPVTARASGLRLTGQVRDLAFLGTTRLGRLLLVARNDAPVQVIRVF